MSDGNAGRRVGSRRRCRRSAPGAATGRRRDRGGGRRRRRRLPAARGDPAPADRHGRPRWSGSLVDAAEEEANEVGYAGLTVRVGGPAGGRGAGHRLHLLRLEGPPVGRGALAADAGPPPGRRVRGPADARAAGGRGAGHGALHHREPGPGRRLHGGPAQHQSRCEAPARPDRRPDPPSAVRGAGAPASTRGWSGCWRPPSRERC